MRTSSPGFASAVRHVVFAMALLFCGTGLAAAATPAEALISGNINTGLEILNDRQLDTEQRRVQFENFLLGVTDLKRVATFTLGPYGAKASPEDRDGFAIAFQNYAVAVYQSYFAKYAGQSLTVTGSRQVAPQDDIVSTVLIDPTDRGGRPLEVDFRVRSNAAKPVIVDFAVAGVWLAPAERDEFAAYLGQNGGDVRKLIAYLDQLRGRIAGGG
ncbi:MAG: ABC transporter substrate-binding protein [Rhizomicrobium sp.]